MKHYNRRNFLELLKYTALAHGATALIYIVALSSLEQKYAENERFDELHTILFIVSLVSFAISAVVMLTAHFANSEKKNELPQRNL